MLKKIILMLCAAMAWAGAGHAELKVDIVAGAADPINCGAKV